MRLLQICLLVGAIVFSATASTVPPLPLTTSQEICLLPSETGRCFALFEVFYYNRETGNCEKFYYGGCGGNANRFQTLEECQEACGGIPPPTAPVDSPSTIDDSSIVCTVGSRWKDDCNWCNCIDNGKIAVCTKMGCSPLRGSLVVDEPECEGDSRWKKDCNWCNCVEGRAVCTLKECISNPPELPQPVKGQDLPICKGKARWRNSCNWCSCVNGSISCTDKKCTAEINKQLEGEPDCEGVEVTFVRDCKGCVCDHGSLTCHPTACAEECDRSQCPWKRWGHYKAKGCLPQYDGSCCPTSFLCSSNDGTLQGKQDNCTYKNKVYDLGETIDVDDECSASCRCVNGSVPSGSAEILCASVECPHLFQEARPGCRALYRVGDCCPYDHECESPPNLQVHSETPTCLWNNKTYLEGDQMFFDEYPCQKCICTEKFADPFGPGCSKIDCGLDFRYTARYEQGCVPIYFEERCCPVDWLCPDDSRIVTEDLSQEITDEAADRRPDQCHLGSLSIEVGNPLKLSNCETDCRCITPPELTCVKYRNCDAAAENQPKDCPEIKCGSECNPVINAITGCLSCSCENQSFTCPDPACSPLCETTINYQTGCPTCYCRCPPLDESGRPPCPMDCTVRTIIDSDGCQICECDPNDPGHPFGSHNIVTRDNCIIPPPCPMDCATRMVLDALTGCTKCECIPNKVSNPFGCIIPPPCPMDCATRMVLDALTGCTKCECNPNEVSNPFGEGQIPTPPCPVNPDGLAPCPQDCAIVRLVDEATGCEICKCDPNKPGNSFRPPVIAPVQNCPKGPDGRAPCPLDCGILRFTDEKTGCEVCKCDPNNPGNPFGPTLIAPLKNCPKGPDGRAPCPLDCAILRFTDEKTGCEVCKCDPNNPGNSFGSPSIQLPQNNNCPKGPNGRAPCPLDCAVLRSVDERTGCEICKCDPNKPGNPFAPIHFPRMYRKK